MIHSAEKKEKLESELTIGLKNPSLIEMWKRNTGETHNAATTSSFHLRSSKELLGMSILARTLLELLRRRCLLASLGSTGDRPEDLANKFSTSVREITPIRRPLSLAPGEEPLVNVDDE